MFLFFKVATVIVSGIVGNVYDKILNFEQIVFVLMTKYLSFQLLMSIFYSQNTECLCSSLLPFVILN